MAKESDLEAPGVTKPWTLPPEPKPPAGLPPLPPVPGPPSAGLELAPGSARDAAGPKTFEDFASRMGREVVKVTPLFRVGAVLILAGALVLAFENGMIFAGTVGQIENAQQWISNPGNNTSAQGTGNTLSNMQSYFAMLTIATRLDILGFAALGAGALLIGLGSQGIVFRHRFDGQERRPSKLILVFAAISGICAFLWVMYTTGWRTELTGASTGDWSFIPRLFNVQDWIQSRGVPNEVATMADSFPRASQGWIYAAVVQIPAALFFYLAGWRLKKETGIRIGGMSWLVFSITALIGVVVAISATIGALRAVGDMDFTDPNSWQGSIASIGLQLGVAAGTKLLFVPLWGTISFAVLSIAGLKLMMIKPGKVTMSDKLLKEILKAQPAPEAAPVSQGDAFTSRLGAPAASGPGQPATSTALPGPKQADDVVISLMGPPQAPPPEAPPPGAPQPPPAPAPPKG